jgi:FixJ family two-component response regulator
MTDELPQIIIVDDDESVRKGLLFLLRSAGYNVKTYSDAESLLNDEPEDRPGVILLDVFLEGRSALEFHYNIRNRFGHYSVIYISGFGDIPMTVQALKNGALDFLEKPLDESKLLKAIDHAAGQSRLALVRQSDKNRIREIFESLTPREYQVFNLLICGKLNKQVADELHIKEHTVKILRGKITAKLGVKSIAEMIRMAEKL